VGSFVSQVGRRSGSAASPLAAFDQEPASPAGCGDGRSRAGETCFVTDEHGVVLGRRGRAALSRDDDVSVETANTS
jgi:hypothetical protein